MIEFHRVHFVEKMVGLLSSRDEQASLDSFLLSFFLPPFLPPSLPSFLHFLPSFLGSCWGVSPEDAYHLPLTQSHHRATTELMCPDTRRMNTSAVSLLFMGYHSLSGTNIFDSQRTCSLRLWYSDQHVEWTSLPTCRPLINSESRR